MTLDQQLTDSSRWVLATDLDGTLLDRGYDLDHAARSINAVRARYVWVAHLVLATSKTLVELLPLASRCDQPPVLIFENGGGYAVCDAASLDPETTGTHSGSGYRAVVFASDYASIRQTLLGLRAQEGFRFKGFGDMDTDELCRLTGLSPHGATLAKSRAASEPLLWLDTDQRLVVFRQSLREFGLSLVRGGQFYHVSSSGTDKARALQDWQNQHASNQPLLACGDAPNDFQMLSMAERAIVFPGAHGVPLLPVSATTSHACRAGPEGWLQAVRLMLDELSEDQRSTDQAKYPPQDSEDPCT